MLEAPRAAIKSPSLRHQKVVFRLAFLIILLVSALAFYSTQRLIGASERVERTQNMLVETNRFLSEIRAVESSSRGYFVTGDDRYLKIGDANSANARRTAARIRELQTSGELRQRLDRLVALAELRLEYSNRVVRQRESSAEALRNIRLGSNIMDRVRNSAESIIATQTRAYRAEQQRLEREAWLTSIALAAGVLVCLGAIAWLFAIRGREVDRRRQAEQELTALNRELDERVAERTVQLLASQERASLIIDAALDAVITIDDTGAITGWNPQAEKTFGWTRKEALGRPIDETVMPERFRQAHRAGLARYLATGEAHVLNRRIELMALRRDGEEFPVELSITPVHEGETATFSAFIRDVSEAKERTAQVKRAGDLLNAVVENLPDMILLKEPSGDGFRYLLVNAAGEKLLERDRSEILGKTERELFPAAEAALIVQSNKAVAESGRARTFTERKLTTPSGVRTVETRMVPIANSSGETALILAIVRDVSEARAREEQLRQLQRMDAIGRLTGGVAHDFNNLLAIIYGNSELLRTEQEEGSDAAEMIKDVIDAAERGAELVKRLLAFARMQHLEAEPVDLNARLPNILGLLQRALGENVSVRIKPAKRLWPANLDPTQVDDALVNLAINARDAMPEGGTLTIETQNVSLDEDYAAHHVEVNPGDYVMLAVSDTGTGMPPDVIARAFEPFFTTKEEGRGTGLGLSQVFGWVKQSGGHIKIYSEVGHGTTIKLYLPRAEAPSVEKDREPEIPAPKGDETILVVEDNPNVRKTVIRQLHDLGYKTVEAPDGPVALQLVRDGLAFDLLLTDVVMPGGITGYQLADELRRDRPDLKVLFTSGYTDLAAASRNSARKDPLLSKPYRKQDLGRAVRTVLDGMANVETAQ